METLSKLHCANKQLTIYIYIEIQQNIDNCMNTKFLEVESESCRLLTMYVYIVKYI